MFFAVVLALGWFFLYWIIGGVFFACVALLRLKKIHKVRFSCLFTLTSILCASGAAWWGSMWAKKEIEECVPNHIFPQNFSEKVFVCGFSEFLFSMLIGLIVLIIIGFGLLKLSSRKERNWLTTFAERLEYNDQEKERE